MPYGYPLPLKSASQAKVTRYVSISRGTPVTFRSFVRASGRMASKRRWLREAPPKTWQVWNHHRCQVKAHPSSFPSVVCLLLQYFDRLLHAFLLWASSSARSLMMSGATATGGTAAAPGPSSQSTTFPPPRLRARSSSRRLDNNSKVGSSTTSLVVSSGDSAASSPVGARGRSSSPPPIGGGGSSSPGGGGRVGAAGSGSSGSVLKVGGGSRGSSPVAAFDTDAGGGARPTSTTIDARLLRSTLRGAPQGSGDGGMRSPTNKSGGGSDGKLLRKQAARNKLMVAAKDRSFDMDEDNSHHRLANNDHETGSSKTAVSSQLSWAVSNTYRQVFYRWLSLPSLSSISNSQARQYWWLFESLGLTEREVAFLHLYYRDCDSDGSGCISRSELLSFLDVPSRTYFQRVFALFDEDGSGQVDFKEFVLAIWNYASLPKQSLIQFTFDLYDRDSSGVLEASEVERIVRDCYGRTLQANAAAQLAITKASQQQDDGGSNRGFTLTAFASFASRHSVLLLPAFIYQQRIRDRVGGEVFWRSCTDKRLQLSSGKYVPIQVLMQARFSPSVSMRLDRIDMATITSKARQKSGHHQDHHHHQQQGEVVVFALSPAMLFLKTLSETLSSRKQRDDDDGHGVEDDWQQRRRQEHDDKEEEERRRKTAAAAGGLQGGGGETGSSSSSFGEMTAADRSLSRTLLARDATERILEGYGGDRRT